MPDKEEAFKQPSSPEEGEARRIELTQDIESIQNQLGDRDRTDESGNRLSSEKYWEWRKKAQHSLNQKLKELRSLKSWLRNVRNEKPAKLEEAIFHIEQMLSIAMPRVNKRTKQEDRKKMDAAQGFLDRVRAGESNGN